MNQTRLERQADLLLVKSGYDKNGRKVRKNKRKALQFQLKKAKNTNLPHKIIKENQSLIQQRKDSDLSKHEKTIAEFLIKEAIFFRREVFMKGLFNPDTNKPLFFDFYIPAYNLVIEYDGPQHFKNKDTDALILTKKRDRIKDAFCRQRKINILRIPYWKQKRIEHLICEKCDTLTQ